MDSKEFQFALSDLEKRLDRLRALYEQYFRGYERLEPLIPRKDFERRIYALRKELPRNTAMRFRFQQLQQRYTMFTTRWGRLTRQVEEGTHPLVLERLRRSKKRRAASAASQRKQQESAPAQELDLDESLNLSDLLDDAAMAEVASRLEAMEEDMAKEANADEGQRTGRFAPVADLGPSSSRAPASAPRRFSPVRDDAARPPERPARPSRRFARVREEDPPNTPRGESSSTRRVVGGQGAPPMSEPRAGEVVRRSFGPPGKASNRGREGAEPRGPASSSSGNQRAVGGSQASLGEGRVRAIYQEFSAARRANNEPEVKYETVAKRIQQQLPELRRKHAGRDIDFEVVVHKGRVGLKPRTR